MANGSEKVNKKDFIEIEYTGYANGEIFDSNIDEDVKKLNQKSKGRRTIICAGEGMLVSGLDNALEGKELGKEYEVDIGAKEGFGERKRELVKTIPLSAFAEKKVNPSPGMVLTLDNFLVRIITVSGARVVTDFNNPLAGKKLKYKFKIVRKVLDDNEKASALFEIFFRFIPSFEIEEKRIVVKGMKDLEVYVEEFGEKFKELLGKDLEFEEKKEGLEDKVEGEKEKRVGEKEEKIDN